MVGAGFLAEPPEDVCRNWQEPGEGRAASPLFGGSWLTNKKEQGICVLAESGLGSRGGRSISPRGSLPKNLTQVQGSKRRCTLSCRSLGSLLAFWTRSCFAGGSCPTHCRQVSSIPASSHLMPVAPLPPVVTNRMSRGIVKCPLRGKSSQLKTAGIDGEQVRGSRVPAGGAQEPGERLSCKGRSGGTL